MVSGHPGGQGNANESWQHEVMPYLSATAMKRDVEAGQLPKTSIDMKFQDIVDVLDFGFMTTFEAREGRWRFLGLSVDASLFGGAPGTMAGHSGKKHRTDAYIGVRAPMPINEKWTGVGYVDAGGAGFRL